MNKKCKTLHPQIWVLLSAYFADFISVVIFVVLTLNFAVLVKAYSKVKSYILMSTIGSLIFPNVMLHRDFQEHQDDSWWVRINWYSFPRYSTYRTRQWKSESTFGANKFSPLCITEKLCTVLEIYNIQLPKTVHSFSVKQTVQKLLSNFYTCTLIHRDRGLHWHIYLESNIFLDGCISTSKQSKKINLSLWTQIYP